MPERFSISVPVWLANVARMRLITPMQAIDLLLTRRSVSAKKLSEPGPSGDQLRILLTAGLRVADHGKLGPWHVQVFDKKAQAALGEQWASLFVKAEPEATMAQIEFERQRPQRAPVLLAVIYEPQLGKIPPWEQMLSVGAACQNILNAAHAMGFAANWLTEWPAYHADVVRSLSAAENAQIAGFIYIGTPTELPEPRPRPGVDERVTGLA